MTQPLKIPYNYFILPDLYQNKTRRERDPDKAFRIIGFISQKMGIPYSDLLSQTRKREINYCRQLCMYVLRNRTTLSLEKIAALFARGDHTTVKNALKRIENYLATDKDKKDQVERFMSAIY
jgi:chromosomal replication initiator protein